MPAFPNLDYSMNGYGYTVEPNLINTVYVTNNTRQRKVNQKRDDIFTINMRLDETELATFETFVLDTINGGADTYDAPYYTSDVEYTGTAHIVNGEYSIQYLSTDYWNVSFNMEIKDRDLSEEEVIYDTIIALSGFSNAYLWVQALEDMINNNNL